MICAEGRLASRPWARRGALRRRSDFLRADGSSPTGGPVRSRAPKLEVIRLGRTLRFWNSYSRVAAVNFAAALHEASKAGRASWRAADSYSQRDLQPFVAGATKRCERRFMVPRRDSRVVETSHEPPRTADFPVGRLAGWKTGVTGTRRFRVSVRDKTLGIRPFHEPRPLTPSLSPGGGEGVRRTGEGVWVRFMVPRRGSRTVMALPDRQPLRTVTRSD